MHQAPHQLVHQHQAGSLASNVRISQSACSFLLAIRLTTAYSSDSQDLVMAIGMSRRRRRRSWRLLRVTITARRAAPLLWIPPEGVDHVQSGVGIILRTARRSEYEMVSRF